MRWQWSEKTVVILAMSLCTVLFAVGWFTREDPAEKSYLQVSGGGFIFNYRTAEAFYGFTADVLRPVEVGSILEATFENPSGGDPYVVSDRLTARTTTYSLRTPPLQGIAAHKPYIVAIRLYDRQHDNLIWEMQRSYSSQLSDEVMPKHPLTIGPGHHSPKLVASITE